MTHDDVISTHLCYSCEFPHVAFFGFEQLSCDSQIMNRIRNFACKKNYRWVYRREEEEKIFLRKRDFQGKSYFPSALSPAPSSFPSPSFPFPFFPIPFPFPFPFASPFPSRSPSSPPAFFFKQIFFFFFTSSEAVLSSQSIQAQRYSAESETKRTCSLSQESKPKNRTQRKRYHYHIWKVFTPFSSFFFFVIMTSSLTELSIAR